MQDRYVADVGDFGKYAILRRLCGLPGESLIRIGVLWYLFPDEVHNNDGRHTSYLRSSQFLGLDAQLLCALKRIVDLGKRSISSVISAGILSPETVFCNALVVPPDVDLVPRMERLHYRSAWLDKCFTLTENCDLIFFDPDNGLETPSVPKIHLKAGKYVYWDELDLFWQRGQSLLVYHHLNRTMSSAQQVRELAIVIGVRLPGAVVRPLVYRRGSSRVFWLVYRKSDLGIEMERRALGFLDGVWSRHFRPTNWPEPGFEAQTSSY
jgi:hypothetical protein